MTGPLSLLLAYLIGAVPFGFLIVRWRTGRDVRSMGSGNIGATNVLRTTGRGFGILTLLLDVAKGYVAVYIAERLTGGSLVWMSAAALAVMVGHVFPVFLKFKGGKAVASFLGAFLRLAPVAVAAILVVFLVTVAVKRYISLGSIVAAGSFPLAVWLILHPGWPLVAASILAGALIIWRHKSNIDRLREGTEHVLSLGSRGR